MITHDEVRKLLNTTEMGETPTRLYERKLKIHDYITQQEKVTELLGLYREKSDFLAHIMNGNKGLQENYMKLLGTIGELEKELGELK